MDRRFEHYTSSKYRINVKDGPFFPKNLRRTDNVNYYQILIPKQLVEVVLWACMKNSESTPESSKQ